MTVTSVQSETTPSGKGILFTAFEPSGDDHASALIEELRRRQPDLPVYAAGGPKMERAGATLIERTGQDAVMGMPGLGKILEHKHMNKRIGAWMDLGLASVHVAVDSPAANFPICALAKKRGMKVVHMVAPQLWAWGPWRIKKLRRLTDLVLCVLPFEESWFLERNVPARFIGHPLFDEPVDLAACDTRIGHLPTNTPRVALMPGSRPGEMQSSLPILLDMFRRLRADFPDAAGVVAATTPEALDGMKAMAQRDGGWPEGLATVVGDTDAVVRWCQFAVVVSGTVTLQIARQFKPMVIFYRPNWMFYHVLARWLVSTEMFTLPNLIAGRRIVPEFIPHFGTGEPLVIEVIRLMRQSGYADDQVAELRKVVARFAGTNAADSAIDAIEQMLGVANGAPIDGRSIEPVESR